MMRLRLPPSIRFGTGTLPTLADALRECGVGHALVVTDRGVMAVGVTDRVLEVIVGAGVRYTVFDEVRPAPTDTQAERCASVLAEAGCDGIVAVGGGSVIDAAKAAAARHATGVPLAEQYGLNRVTVTAAPPVIAVPTTPGTGSEVSSHASITDAATGDRRPVSGPALVPRAAVIDPELARTLPPQDAVSSGLDGLMHAVEAYLAVAANGFADALALPAIRLTAEVLPTVAAGNGDGSVWAGLGLGCLQANLAMANVNAGLPHALGYPLSMRFGISHGVANALVAPAVLRASRPVQRERDAAAAAQLPGAPACLADGVAELLAAVQLPARLTEHGVKESDVDELATTALRFGPIRRNWRLAATHADIAAMYRAAL
jgi:alcohol dehydrogenase class IV